MRKIIIENTPTQKRRVVIEGNPTVNFQQGGDVTNSQFLTGNYAKEEQNPTIEAENGEYIKNSEDNSVKEIVGKKHTQGGVQINAPDQSKILSDYTKIGANNVKVFSEMFDIKLKATDTFATVLDKFNSKIGVNEAEDEEKKLLERFEKNDKSSIDKNTKKVNEDFLSQEIAEVNKKKASLNKLKSQAFETIFEEQEKIPKRGNGTQILDKSGNPIKQEGGDMQQQQPSPEQIIQAYAQAIGQDPQQIVQQLQQMQPEEQQQALQQMLQGLQQGQEQQPQMQEGGQQGQEELMQKVASALQRGAKPEDVLRQLVSMGMQQEQAVSFIQQIMSAGQQAPQEEGMEQPQMRQGGMYDEKLPLHQAKPTVEIDPRYSFYTPGQYDVPEANLTNQDYLHQSYVKGHEGNVSGGIDPAVRAKYLSEELPYTTSSSGFYVNGTPNYKNTYKFQDAFDGYNAAVDNAARVNPYLKGEQLKNYKDKLAADRFKLSRNDVKYANTGGYDNILGLETSGKKSYSLPLLKKLEIEKYPSLKKLGDILDDKGKVKAEFTGISPETKKVLEDTYKSSGIAGKDIGLGFVNEQGSVDDTTSSDTTPYKDINTKGKPQKDVVKDVIYEGGLPYVMPPSASIAPYLQQANLNRLEGQKGSVENQLQASENARQAAMESVRGLPPAQAAAMMANFLAASGQQDTQGIAQQEVQDLQNKARIEQYNASQGDKEQILNEQLKKQYEREAFTTLNQNEQSWRNYYNVNQDNQNLLSDKIERRNILNTTLDNYQINGSGGVDFVNQSPFRGADQAMIAYNKWFNSLTPEQKVKERKKMYGSIGVQQA